MNRPVVFVTRQLPDVALQILSKHAEVRVHHGTLPPTRQELLAGASGCSGILSLLSDRIDAEVMDAAGTKLRVISNFAVGYNNIDIDAAKLRKIQVGNTPDVLTQATADMAVALVLAVARRVREGWQSVESGNWKTWEPLGWLGVELEGRTLGIVGMGRIGAAVARKLRGGWGMQVLYTARTPKPTVDCELQSRHVSLQQLVESSDVISVHVPLSEQTRHLIGKPEFDSMKSEAILVNTARGEVIDQAALEAVLSEGKIFGAGLDVCTPEPLPPESGLLKLNNCLVVPHIGSATQTARSSMARRAAENIVAGLSGQQIPFSVGIS
ncbi:MAG: D-glycerate dehydrogenase [Planctomycetales bacterium]|nr:D-glycerate dehydrogenase [Planctomycetales bacterium]